MNFNEITIQSGSTRYTLTNGSVIDDTVDEQVTVQVMLDQDDVVALKSNLALTATDTNTMIELAPQALADTSGNFITSVTVANIDTLSPDTTNPILTSFSLNLQTDILMLTFSDVVDGNTLEVTAITLQSEPTRIDGQYFTLTSESSQAVISTGYTITINLGNDGPAIRSNPYFGTSIHNTYITILGSTIDSPSGMDNIPITDGKGLRATAVVFDAVAPELIMFTLDMNNGLAIFTFSDFVDINSLQLIEFVFQDNEIARRMYRLTGGSPNLNCLVLMVMLSNNDLNGIQATQGLVTYIRNTYLIITSNAISDISGNHIEEIPNGNALQAAGFIADSTRPSLRNSTLDRDRGMLSLQFTEFVDTASFQGSQVTLQSQANSRASLTKSSILFGSEPVSEEASDLIQLRLLL